MNERLNLLLKKHHTSLHQLSKVLGETFIARIRNYVDGRQKTISIADLITLSDYFGVSIDYLVGRSDNLDPEYDSDVRALYEKSYEMWLVHNKGNYIYISTDDRGPFPQYPYNLIEQYTLPLDEPVADQVKVNLEQVIASMLTPREALCVDRYFRQYMTLEDIGREFDVGRERIRQILAKAGRKLRHPSRLKYIMNGLDYKDRINEEYEKRRAELILEEVEHKLNECLDEKPIDILDLSVRSYNCLKRAGIETLGQLRACDIEELMNMRNLGRKSLEEILAKCPELIKEA
jgi:transcriptional regulator with XRE-family HTH domain